MRIRNKIVTMCYAIVLLLSIYHIALAQNDFEVDASQVGQAAAHPPEMGYTIIRGVDGQERACSMKT